MKEILDHTAVVQKIKRIAFEIYEKNFEEQSLTVVGIAGGGHGYTLASLLADELRTISPLEVTLIKLDLNKTDTSLEIQLSDNLDGKENGSIILVDDVINTGRTLVKALIALAKYSPRKVKIATMVNRAHLNYPIYAQYIGYSLATTLDQTVAVDLADSENYHVSLHS